MTRQIIGRRRLLEIAARHQIRYAAPPPD